MYIASALNYPLLSRYARTKIVTRWRKKSLLVAIHTQWHLKKMRSWHLCFSSSGRRIITKPCRRQTVFFSLLVRGGAPCQSKLTWNIKYDLSGISNRRRLSLPLTLYFLWSHSSRCSCGCVRCLPYRNQFQLKVDLRGWSDWSLSVSQFPLKPCCLCANRVIRRENRSPKWNHFNALLLHDNDHNDDFYDYLLYLKPFLCHFIDFLSPLYVLTH